MALKSIPPPPREPITQDYVSSNWDMWFSVLSKRVSEIVVATGAFGTVTSVTVATPGAGLFSSGSPITVAGTINITLNDDVAAIEALTGLGHLSRTGVNTWALSTTIPWADITVTPTTLVGYGITDAQPLDATLTSLAAYNTNGLLVQTSADVFAGRSLVGTANITIANADGTTGNPVIDLATLGDSGLGTFLKITRDTFGRLTGTTAVATSDLTTLLQATLDLKANLISPALTGVPIAPTATLGTNTTQIATTAFVQAEVASGSAVVANTALLMQYAAAHG